jgi:hypothetical protein
MRHLLSRIAILVALLMPIGALAQPADITGSYSITGENPGGGGAYRGEVVVKRTDDTYQVLWRLGPQEHVGTGIFRDGQFSVVYQPRGEPAGIAVYIVSASGTLNGLWTGLGGQFLGIETWTRKDRL